MRALHYSVVMKRESSKNAKLSIFKAVFIPILTYGHESWVSVIKRVRSQVQASEKRFLQRIEEVALFALAKLNDLELDGPITLRILDGIAWDFTQAKW